MKLSQLKVGNKAVITRIDTTYIYYNRLIKMGVNIGEKLEVKRISILGSPMLINVCNYNLCIGKDIAKHIDVKLSLV